VTHVLVDTSVLIKWFHAEGEGEVSEARAIRDAHLRSDLDAHVLDLAAYEVGNVLARALRWPAARIADQLDDLRTILGIPLVPSPAGLRLAATLAEAHSLTFYDASWAAAARELDVTLISADRRLIESRLAESPRATVMRLRLPSV
jgi:predicted nucleic acid-binding protein